MEETFKPSQSIALQVLYPPKNKVLLSPSSAIHSTVYSERRKNKLKPSMVSSAKVNAAIYFILFSLLNQKCHGFAWSKVFWLATDIPLQGIHHISLTLYILFWLH